MAIETPATIAILGSGPIGLEAALYARFLGYDVDIYERGEVADNVRAWGHVTLFSPFRMNHSPLGIAALKAQDPTWEPPDDDELLTGNEFRERYLLPLAQSDLLFESVHTETEVKHVGRPGLLKVEFPGGPQRGEEAFRLILRDADGIDRAGEADVVIDTTGTYGNHSWLGKGGIPALSEQTASGRIAYDLPDILGRRRALYAGKRTLLIGSGYSAATSAVALAELANQDPETRVTWITRRPLPENGQGPLPRFANDPLTHRDRIAEAANKLAIGSESPLTHFSATSVVAIHAPDENSPLTVQLESRDGDTARTIEVDRILANIGYRPDLELCRELQVQVCHASEAPMKLALHLGGKSLDCLAQGASGPESLVTTEPNFYVLGSKSYGRNSHFLISVGIEQIRDVFTLIGGRADLDLYDSAKPVAARGVT